MRELPFVQVKATSRQVLAGPYGVLPAAFAQVTVGSCNSGVVTRRSRVECAASGRYISGALDSGAVHAVMHEIRSFDGAARVIGGASATFARRWCARVGQRGGKRMGRRWLKPASGLAAVAVVGLVSFGSS